MNNKRKPIKNVTYNFSEEDIEVCKSLDKLRYWWDKVQIDIESMENKIRLAKKNGRAKEDWLDSINGALSLQKELSKIIYGRIVELKNDPPEYCLFEMMFAEVCKKRLSRELFEELENETKKRIIYK
jgi:hypothetical protein